MSDCFCHDEALLVIGEKPDDVNNYQQGFH
jgi:hypothetical protein